jgi:hypothetical protein
MTQLLAGVFDRQVQLLNGSRHPQHPGLVPEVPFELPQDAHRGVGGKRGVVLRVEAMRSLDQGQVRHLLQLVRRLAPVKKAASQGPGQPHMLGNQVLLQPASGQVAQRPVRRGPVAQAALGLLGRPPVTGVLPKEPALAVNRA